LQRYGEPRQPRTLVLGLTFKENLPDLRNTRVVDVVQRLKKRGHRVDVHDARADADAARDHYGIELLRDLPKAKPGEGGYDCLIGAVAHDAYRNFTTEDFARLVRPGGLVADIKGMWRDADLPEGLGRWQL
ncbi:MAG: UDP binding domain-containing protein, partial [Dongiaceae bacterium]